MDDRYPDFYIVGAPKCGTTALYSYLNRHPQVFLPSFKEPNYFLTDLPNVRHFPTEADYLKLYRDAPKDALRGESSAWNLFSTTAAAEIAKVRPDARIIILLRNPVEAARSLHFYNIPIFLEDKVDFCDAWRAQSERRQNKNLPFYCPHKELILYRDVYLYHPQVGRYLAEFNREQVKIILFEDFIKDTRREYLSVLKFLGLDDACQNDEQFTAVNESFALSNQFILNNLRAPSRGLRPLIMTGKRMANAIGIKPSLILHKLMAKPQKKKAISEELRGEVAAAFTEDIAALEGLTGIDLARWKDQT